MNLNEMTRDEEQAILQTVERTLEGETSSPDAGSLVGFCTLLASLEPQPAPSFQTRLWEEAKSAWEQAVREEPSSTPAARRRYLPLTWRAWSTAAAVFALVLLLSLALIGPQRALAEVQQLLGYVPGIGFVRLEEARILAAPVELTRDGVTLRITDLVAERDRTLVVFESEGLTVGDHPEGVTSTRSSGDVTVLLVLPDGQQLRSEIWSWRYGGGSFEFPSLPDNIYRATLHVSRLPLVEVGTAPEAWEVPFVLRPVTGESTTFQDAAPYTPSAVSDSQDGITVQVVEVVHAPEETLVRLRAEWTDERWQSPRFGPITNETAALLADNVGHIYRQQPPSSHGSFARGVVNPAPRSVVITDDAGNVLERRFFTEETIVFPPVSRTAQELTLTLRGFEASVSLDGSFELDLGDDPQPGDYWPLDVELLVEEVPVHINGVWLRETSEERGKTEPPYALEFDIEPFPAEALRTLTALRLSTSAAGAAGSGSGHDASGRHLTSWTSFSSVPRGHISVSLEAATVFFHNPWTLTWSTPGSQPAEAHSEAVTVRPECQEVARNGIALCVEEVVLTDRLTSVRVRASDVPDGATWEGVLEGNCFDDSTSTPLYLADNRGSRYEPLHCTGSEQEWPPDIRWKGATSPHQLDGDLAPFAPVNTLAGHVSFEVEEVALTWPTRVIVDIEVPTGIEYLPREPVGYQSEAWPVSIPVDIQGYQWRWEEARLMELGGRKLLVLTSAPFELERGQYPPKFLQLGSITAPDGATTSLEDISPFTYGEHGFVSVWEDGKHHAVLYVDLGAVSGPLVEPGIYTVELRGITVAVPGPWKLSWNMPGH